MREIGNYGVWMALRGPSRYVDTVDPVIIASARKHRVHDDDIRHAYRQPVRVLELDDQVVPANPPATLEIGVSRADGIDFIIHAMPARPKFIR